MIYYSIKIWQVIIRKVQNMTEPNGIETLRVHACLHAHQVLVTMHKTASDSFQVMQWKLLRVLHLYVPEGGWAGGQRLGGEGCS